MIAGSIVAALYERRREWIAGNLAENWHRQGKVRRSQPERSGDSHRQTASIGMELPGATDVEAKALFAHEIPLA